MASIVSALFIYSVLSSHLTNAQTVTSNTIASGISAQITGCHYHDNEYRCFDANGDEGVISPAPTATTGNPARYTSCHTHGSDIYCMYGSSEVQFILESDEDHEHESASASASITESVTITTNPSTITSNTQTALSGQTTAVTGCHFHGTTQYCLNGQGVEGVIVPAPTATDSAPSEYTGCHSHGDETYCMNGSSEVQFVSESEEDHEDHASASATITTNPSTITSNAQTALSGQTTAVTGCHFHGTTQYCLNGQGVEGVIVPAPTATDSAPSEYTGCHSHGDETYCMNGSSEVQFTTESEEASSESSSESASESGVSCHFHAGVEHCVDANGVTVESTCEYVDRDRNVNLRVGLLFAILAGTAFAVTLPVFLQRFAKISIDGIIFTILKQFGTGVIISTALVHLVTHAQLMFANTCVGKLAYESTSTAIVMAGAFLAFCFEYIFGRLLSRRQNTLSVQKNEPELGVESDQKNEQIVQTPTVIGGHDHNAPLINPQDKVSVLIIEAGVIFHSILIGLTLVVAGDSSLIVLFIVILFHQMFEGIALGARISGLTSGFWQKIFMCSCYAVTTPIGMAIGLGVLSKFNGNDKSTIIAIGTIDSVSAGILLWTGLVDMLAMDWIFGPLARSGLVKTICAFISLLAGMILMSVLGKWT